MASKDIKVPGVPNLYRRGVEYVGRVSTTDAFRHRTYRKALLGTTDKNEAIARLGQLTASVKIDHVVPVSRARRMTVEEFLMDHWLPYKQQRIVAGRFEESTLDRYQRDLRPQSSPPSERSQSCPSQPRLRREQS
jgi:hypothetical protein